MHFAQRGLNLVVIFVKPVLKKPIDSLTTSLMASLSDDQAVSIEQALSGSTTLPSVDSSYPSSRWRTARLAIGRRLVS